MTRPKLVRIALQLGVVAGGLTAGALIWGAAPAFADSGATPPVTPPGVTVSVQLGSPTPVSVSIAPVTVTLPAVQLPAGLPPIAPPPIQTPPVVIPVTIPAPVPVSPLPGTPSLPVLGIPSPVTLPFIPIPPATGPIATPSSAVDAPGPIATASEASPATPVDDLLPPAPYRIIRSMAVPTTAAVASSVGAPEPVAPVPTAPTNGPVTLGTAGAGFAGGADHRDQPTAVLPDPIRPDAVVGRAGLTPRQSGNSATPGCADPRPG